MQPEPTEPSQNASVRSANPDPSTSTHHGLFGDPSELSSSPPLQSGERGGSIGGSSTEWSLSPTSELASPGSSALAGLSPRDTQNEHEPTELDIENLSLSLTPTATKSWLHGVTSHNAAGGEQYTLHEFPEELLFQVMSHLPAQDLLTVKLVSRRFYSLVTSPTAWSNAFSKYFPGPESLRSISDVAAADKHGDIFHTEARVFTRLSASVSWSSEYLARTRLLRALMRGRPSLPFAAPCPGKPGKGSATFTFASRILRGCTTLDADFGSIFDKRKPQFIHGSALSGSVTSSDRRGKFDAWGFSNPVFFRHFHEIHPGLEPYGMGSGTCVGVPNMMELSQQYGMSYGEGTPGGSVHFLGAGEKHAKSLISFTGITNRNEGVPRLSADTQCPTALWIARSTAMPRMSQGLVGMLVGSSNGVVTAHSLGPQSGQRHERGEITARWILSPGVPIIAVCADDHYHEERASVGRIWGFALNALGELFTIHGNLEQAASPPVLRNATPEELAEKEEFRAWQTGRSKQWKLIPSTICESRYKNVASMEAPLRFPSTILDTEAEVIQEEMLALQPWFIKQPIELRSEFNGWDMRRRLLVDFACDDGRGAGESAVVISSDSDASSAILMRYKRVKTLASERAGGKPAGSTVASGSNVSAQTAPSSWSFSEVPSEPTPQEGEKAENGERWLHSQFQTGIYSIGQVTATAIDNSTHANTTAVEDDKLRKARTTARHGRAPRPEPVTNADVGVNVPGRRACLFAVGTAAGFVFVWDMRAATSKVAELSNDIQPVRVIVTDSPGIGSIALSSLYLVHGGTEGLLQAWDLLASTTEPIRTLSSRRLVNNRRRAILAAQQTSVPATWAAQNTERLAASAICLDPDPSVLRGVATIDQYVKYWSFSSASSAEEMSRSQKRRLKKGAGSKNPGLTGGGEAEMSYTGFSGSQRRTNLKGYVSHELHLRQLDEAEQRRSSKDDRRFAGRFGTQLLGPDASEEELLAYATMLSQEEDEKQARRAVESTMKLSPNASAHEVEAHKAALNERDAEKWKYASWKERFEMLPEGGVALPKEMLESQSQVATPTVEDPDLKRAMEQSLQEERERERFLAATAVSPPAEASSSRHLDAAQLRDDPDLAEAIAMSLMQEQGAASSPPELPRPFGMSSHDNTDEDDLARAIRMSLAESSPATEPRRPSSNDENEFPSLASSSPPSSTGVGKRGKGKAPRGAW